MARRISMSALHRVTLRQNWIPSHRRTRLVGQLTEARRLASGRHVRIDTADGGRDRVLKDLPAGIHLEPGELRIEFEGAEDLLRHLYELSQAIRE